LLDWGGGSGGGVAAGSETAIVSSPRWDSVVSTGSGKENPASFGKDRSGKPNTGRTAAGAGSMLPGYGCHHKPPPPQRPGYGCSNITALPSIPQDHSLGNRCHNCVRS
jgi:hypothetical protein